MRESFVFYLSQYDAIKELNNEQLGRLFRAIFEKQLGNEVVLEEDIKIAFNFINNQMVVDQRKYEDMCEKRRASGKKGGAPKGNKNASKNNQTTNDKQNKLNDNENENENENNIKESNKEKVSKTNKVNYEDILKEFSLSPGLEEVFRDFIQMRSFIKKPLTNKGLKLAINKVLAITSKEEERIKIVEQSVMNNWQGLFPLKENSTNPEDPLRLLMEEVANE